MGAMCNDSKKGGKALNREIRQIRERGRGDCWMGGWGEGRRGRGGETSPPSRCYGETSDSATPRRRGGKSSGLIRVVPT
jgi:hypothetical protein